jgi:F-type H+-transporting ATPase subunit b
VLDFSVTFFITLLNIGILYFVLRAILFKPVTRFMENRSLKIKADLDNAAQEKIKAEELRLQYEAAIHTAEQESERILREGRELAMKQGALLMEKAKVEAEGIIRAARLQIEAERRAQAALLKQETADLVLAATGRLLRREVDSEDSRRAAEELVSGLGLN